MSDSPTPLPRRIVSGGQTGVDRAALDVAIELGIPHEGWCPLGRLAEDGRLAERYQLREMPTADYAARTEQNVIDSDATLILLQHDGDLSGGTNLTHKLALRREKPCHVANMSADSPAQVRAVFLALRTIETLNVAGPRETSSPGIYELARAYLRELLGPRSS